MNAINTTYIPALLDVVLSTPATIINVIHDRDSTNPPNAHNPAGMIV